MVKAARVDTGWLGEAGAVVGVAPLGLSGVGVGVELGVRYSFGLVQAGLRGSYSFTPSAGPARLGVHRGTVEGVVAVEGRTFIRPFGELGLGWLSLAFAWDGREVGDLAGFTAHAAAGVGFDVGPVTLRVSGLLCVDLARVDGDRHGYLAPGGQLGLPF
jgi:hypothetical protein